MLSGGRIVLGVGGGAFADGIAAMGAVARSKKDMVAFTDGAPQIIRRALAGGDVEFSGQHNAVSYAAGPSPPAPVPIWLGSSGPRMLTLTGRSSDGWVSPLSIYMQPPGVPAAQQVIDGGARSAGQEPAAVRRLYNVVGVLGAVGGRSGLRGDVTTWVATLTEWCIELWFDTFIFWPTREPLAQVKSFAAQVVPGVRQRVGERRKAAIRE